MQDFWDLAVGFRGYRGRHDVHRMLQGFRFSGFRGLGLQGSPVARIQVFRVSGFGVAGFLEFGGGVQILGCRTTTS